MRLIDADDLLKEIEELKKSPWFNNGRGGCVLHGLYLERKEAVEMVEDICIKQAPTIKTFILADIEEQYKKGLEKGLEERPHGEWKTFTTIDGYTKHATCTNCGYKRKVGIGCSLDEQNLPKYCESCGAEMRKEGEAE